MSKKAQVKDLSSEDVSESSLGVRRSSRISSSQTAVGSPIVKTITTRRTSASSTAGKELNGDSDRISPVIEKRKTRRTSTDSDINPTPIKTRRSSVSKIIEEEKKNVSSPGTPTRKSTRSMSRSPSNVTDVPTRRTRRSSQDTDQVIEQQPTRRSTRRRPSTDTQEESSKEEVVEVAKPVTRRRRSSSTDEPEVAKNDTKQKTKRLFSEDNQLEPIKERETEQKDEPTSVNASENKTVHELSIIQEAEDVDDDESEKIIKDIDDVLTNKVSSPKPKSAVPEKASTKSVFSPLTPKVKQTEGKNEVQVIEETSYKDSPTKDADKIAETESTKREPAKEKRQSLKKTEGISGIESVENAVPSVELSKEKRESLKNTEETSHDESIESAAPPVPLKEKRQSLKKTEETSAEKSPENILDKSTTESKKFISEGSDDSFTLKLSLDKSSLDKSMSKESQNDDDEVFSSPGSNKENSCINIHSKNVHAKQRDSLSNKKTVASPSITNIKRTSFCEAMDVDSDEFSNIQDTSKQLKPSTPISKQTESQENVQTGEDNIDVIEIDSASNSPEPKETADVSINKSFNCINSSQSDHCNSSSNSINSPKKLASTVEKISKSNIRESEDDSSSDLSIKLVDSDEEIFEIEQKVQTPPKVEVKRSKRPRISDGTSKTILQRLQQKIDVAESISENQEAVRNSFGDSKENQKETDNSMKNSEETEVLKPTDEEKSMNSSKSEQINEVTLIKENSSVLCEENKIIDVNPTNEKYGRKSMKSHKVAENEKVSKSASTDDPIKNKSTENVMGDPQSKDQMEAVSPLKSKINQMKDCGINFLNPSPAKPKVKLDSKTDSKLNEFLTKKLNDLVDEDTSEDDQIGKKQHKSDDGSMSEDFEKNEFIDDMAEEYEEDTPSEGSNDIIDEGESINSTESEYDSDESYDLDDSFIADDSETELLPGDEYDLEIDDNKSNAKKPKRKRIAPKQDSTSEDESEQETNKEEINNSEVEKAETNVEKKRKSTYVVNSPRIVEKTDFEKSISEKSSTPVIKTGIPSVCIIEPTPDNVREKSVFEERIRSIVEPKISTPNSSFSEAGNTSKLNNSARSSSIIIQENISISDMQSDLIADKLQQVVKVFCAGIRSSEGNVSMNVSLDFTETTTNAPVPDNNDVINMDNAENEREVVNISQNNSANTSHLSKESPNLRKKRRSSNKLDKSTDDQFEAIKPSTSQDKELIETKPDTRDVSEDLTKSKKRRGSSHKLNKSKEIEPFNSQDELEFLVCGTKSHDLSGQVTKSKRNRRSSQKFDKELDQSEQMEPSKDKEIEPLEICDQADVPEVLSKSRKRRSHKQSEEIEVPELDKGDDTGNVSFNNEASIVPKKRNRRSSNKFEAINTSGEIKEHPSSPSKTVSKRVKEDSNNSKIKITESQISSNNFESNEENEKTTESEPEDKQATKNKKRNRRRKTKSVANNAEPKQQISKRLKLLEMACEELPPNDLRHKLLPSHNEYSKSTNTKTNKNRLKRLQSNLNVKYAHLGELITDVKNRPKRSIKPSCAVENSGWTVVADNVKPSVSNESSAFDYKKINDKDFKNRMLYDPRVKREPTSKLLRNKGYHV